MFNYQKTELGFQVLRERQLALNARQRRLLLLIGTDDFNQMQTQYQQRIAEPTLLIQLLEMQLIQSIGEPAEYAATTIPIEQTSLEPVISPIKDIDVDVKTPLPSEIINTPHIDIQPKPSEAKTTSQVEPYPNSIASVTQIFIEQDFEQLQAYMCSYLQRYCGLIAKKLIEKIQHTDDLAQLKACQMQWITLLNESNIQPERLQQALQQINYSLKNIQALA